MQQLQLERRRLGRANIEVVPLAVGTGSIGMRRDRETDEPERARIAVDTVRRAVELGVDYFDTSPLYQAEVAERSLGLALGELEPAQRAAVRVSTKAGTRPGVQGRYDREAILRSLDQSMAALGCDYLDIVFVHDPKSEQHMEQIFAAGGAVEAIRELVEQGRVGALGIGVRSHPWLLRCIESGKFDVVLTPYDHSPVRASGQRVIDAARAAGVGVVSASPYLKGMLAGPAPGAQAGTIPEAVNNLARAEAIYQWCRAEGIDVGAFAVQFSLRNSGIGAVLVGSRDREELELSVRHATTALPDGVWQAFAAAAEHFPPAAAGGETGMLV